MKNKKRNTSRKATVVSSKAVYKGPVFWVSTDQVREPGGITSRRDIVHHRGSVVILAVDDAGREPRILLARQYRHPAGRALWELPAGSRDEGESTLAGARRELAEETGFTARRWKRILFFWPSPGFVDETMSVYLATGLTRGEATPEEDEHIAVRFFPLSQATRMAMGGALKDGKTIAAVLWLAQARRGPK